MLALNRLRQLAAQAGFDACGATPAVPLPEDNAFLAQWVAAGHNGSMDYLAHNTALRSDIRQMVKGAQTVVVCLLSYYKTDRQPADAPKIALSGLSARDYHQVVKEKLLALETLLQEEAGNSVFNAECQHSFCDSAPVFERRWAQRSGLGWIGRNKMLIHPQLGSFVHIGVLVMNIPLSEYSIPLTDQCGACQQCLQACPTGALRSRMFDARRCVSYLTIERKEALPDHLRPAVSNVLYGCDKCQLACPYNRQLTPLQHPELTTHPLFLKMTKEDWEQTSHRQRLRLLHRLAK